MGGHCPKTRRIYHILWTETPCGIDFIWSRHNLKKGSDIAEKNRHERINSFPCFLSFSLASDRAAFFIYLRIYTLDVLTCGSPLSSAQSPPFSPWPPRCSPR